MRARERAGRLHAGASGARRVHVADRRGRAAERFVLRFATWRQDGRTASVVRGRRPRCVGDVDRVQAAVRRERRPDRRAPKDLVDDSGRAADERVAVPAEVEDRARAAAREVRGVAVRHPRTERRPGAAADGAPRRGRARDQGRARSPAATRRRVPPVPRRAWCGRSTSMRGRATRPSSSGSAASSAITSRACRATESSWPTCRPTCGRSRIARARRPQQAQRRASRRAPRRPRTTSSQTRELSLLKRDAAAKPLALPGARARRPATVRGRRHSAAGARLPRRRGRVAAPRRGAARQAGADVRAHDRAGHEPRRPREVRARQRRRVGDHARPREAGRRRRGADLGLPRQAAVERHDRRARLRVRAAGLPGRRRTAPAAAARATTGIVGEDDSGETGYFVSARKAIADGPNAGKTDVAFVWSNWNEGIESWRFNLPATGSDVAGADDGTDDAARTAE